MKIFFLAFASIWPQSKNYLYSYVLTANQNGYSYVVTDSCEVVDRPTLDGSPISVDFAGGHYYFKVVRLGVSGDDLVGLATFHGHPYSIRENSYGRHYVLSIVPMRFHREDPIDNKRAFVFTNDQNLINKICNGNKK